MRVSSSIVVRSNAGYDARLVGAASAGSGMLQCARSGWDANGGQTSRTRSQRVITMSNGCPKNSSRCLVRLPLMSIPRFFITRTALACSGFGLLPALSAWIVPADICSRSASAIWERALFPVQRNKTRSRSRGASRRHTAHRRRRNEPQPGMQRATRRSQLVLAVNEIDRVVPVAPIRRAAPGGHQPTVTQSAQVVRHQVLRFVDQPRQLPHRPIALDELSQQPPPHRVREEPHETRRITGIPA